MKIFYVIILLILSILVKTAWHYDSRLQSFNKINIVQFFWTTLQLYDYSNDRISYVPYDLCVLVV